MQEELSSVLSLSMALTLGLKHGFDLDHLAAIDAMTRTTRNDRLLSKMVGFLFSLGHGLVVISISLILGSGIVEAGVPEWLDGFGRWISIFFLVVFGLLNLYSVFQKSTSNSTIPVGIKSFLAQKLSAERCTPLMVLIVGALFAFSFDTFSQIALFSLTASLVSGWLFSGLLGFSFMLGMMLADGINGLLVSVLIQRADRASAFFSKSVGVSISLFSLGIALRALL